MPIPAGIVIDGATGALSSSTGHYVKSLSALRDCYEAPALVDAYIAAHGDVAAYEVREYCPVGNDLRVGTTSMAPGRIGREYFLTRGHFHARPDRGEVYWTQSGEGLLLLHSREGECRNLELRAGVCALIPPGWAHRSVNTGAAPLVFVWTCASDAGQDYGRIAARGMRQLVIEQDGRPTVVPNPNYRDDDWLD
jgi:glucose-6-phosphate isomerase